MVWEPDKECMDREDLEQLQLERLQATLNRVYEYVPIYRRRLDDLGISPEDVGSLADLARLPFTTKEDLRANYPYGYFAKPLREVVRIHASSGTTGAFTAVGYTKNDIRTWSGLTARGLAAGGVTKDDVVLIGHDYGLFTGGFGFHYGAERIGASVIPMARASLARQLKMMRDFKTTALVCSPSHALQLADAVRDKGISLSALSLRWGLFGEEPWSEAMRQDLQQRLGITATDNYGLSEVMGPGVSAECLERRGMHLNEDHFLVEVIDPVTLQPVQEGQIGELVITTLTKEAFPMVRYRTRDLTSLLPGACACGRTLRRMARVKGRTDDMLIVGGVNVFPSEIESVLQAGKVGPAGYQVTIERNGGRDEMTVLLDADEVRRQTGGNANDVVAGLQRRFSDELGIEAAVKLVARDELAAQSRKPKKIVDRRTL